MNGPSRERAGLAGLAWNGIAAANQIDRSTHYGDDAVHPTQGKILALMQVNGGEQSYNAVNLLRVLGRWMRRIDIPNSQIPLCRADPIQSESSAAP